MARSCKPVVVRFAAKFVAGAPDDCWEWQGARSGHGYGQLRIGPNGPTGYAHRISYECHVGPIPQGLDVCHHCDNPPCVNPQHLFLGTASDNAIDMVRKGRAANGDRFSSRAVLAKLTPDVVAKIRAEYVPNSRLASTTALGRKYNVSHSAIWYAVKGVTWKDVPDNAHESKTHKEKGNV